MAHQVQVGTTVVKSETPAQARHRGHPGPKQYIAIAVILALITLLEVVVYYLNIPHNVLVPVLIVLSLAKFSLVALFFMHLLFDARFFSFVFVGGMFLALTVFVVVLTMLRIFFA